MINKVILIGNVGADPEVRTLESGVKVARIRLATTERIFNRQTQEGRDHTEWHSVTLWRNLADVVDRFVRKGSQIYVEGRLRSREWEDQNGVKRYGIEIVADEMKLLGRRPEGQAQQPGDTWSAAGAAPSPGQAPAVPAATGSSAPEPVADDPDDLPF